jgi:hypothetical protein
MDKEKYEEDLDPEEKEPRAKELLVSATFAPQQHDISRGQEEPQEQMPPDQTPHPYTSRPH